MFHIVTCFHTARILHINWFVLPIEGAVSWSILINVADWFSRSLSVYNMNNVASAGLSIKWTHWWFYSFRLSQKGGCPKVWFFGDPVWFFSSASFHPDLIGDCLVCLITPFYHAASTHLLLLGLLLISKPLQSKLTKMCKMVIVRQMLLQSFHGIYCHLYF